MHQTSLNNLIHKFNSPITTKFAIKYHAPKSLSASMFSSVYKNQKFLFTTIIPPEIPFYQTEINVTCNPSITSFFTAQFEEKPHSKPKNVWNYDHHESFEISIGDLNYSKNNQKEKTIREFDFTPLPLFLCNLVKYSETCTEEFTVHEFKYSWKYTKRELIPINTEEEINLEPVKPLESKESTFYSSETKIYNFNDPILQKFIKKYDLEIFQGEDAMDFLQRVLVAVCGTLELKTLPLLHRRPSASEVLESKVSNALGFVTLFNAVCRSSKVPSRTLFGHLCNTGKKAHNNKKNSKSLDLAEQIYTDFHVKSEVWIDNLGWIPIEATHENGITNSEPIPFLTMQLSDYLSMDVRTLISRSCCLNYSNSIKYSGGNEELIEVFSNPYEDKFDGHIVKVCNDFLMLWQTARRKRSMELLRQTFAKLSKKIQDHFNYECTYFDSAFFQGHDISFLPFKVTSRKRNKEGTCHSTVMFTELQTMETEEYLISLDIEEEVVVDINIASMVSLHEEDKVEERKLKILGSYVKKDIQCLPSIFCFGTHNQSLHTSVKNQVTYWQVYPYDDYLE
ncbi:hypothetical protein ABK040_005438 [Willaertia magna]